VGGAATGGMGPAPVRRSHTAELSHLHSAGGVVLRPGAGASDPAARCEVAVMRSRYGTWVFPKGGIRPNEEAEAAARRELREEVGLADLNLVAALGATDHQYEANGRRFHKQVDWFLFLAPPGTELHPNAAEHALDAAWFDPRTALLLLTHANQRHLLRRALKVLRRPSSHRRESVER